MPQYIISAGLVIVPKSIILPIRHPRPHLRIHERLFRLSLPLFPSPRQTTTPVPPNVPQKQQNRRTRSGRLSRQCRDLGWSILGSVACLKALCADDAADGRAGTNQGRDKSALRGARDVGGCPLGFISVELVTWRLRGARRLTFQ